MNLKYKHEIEETLNTLVSQRHIIFERALNVAMNGVLKGINDVFENSDIYEFELNHLDNSSDTNLQLLVDLIKSIEKTTESIANLNSIDLKKYIE